MTTGLSGAGFDLDLLRGQFTEDELHNLMHLLGSGRIEVKCDEKCRQTGNLFVEIRQKGRPSGLATTRAMWWAFGYDIGSFLIVPVDRLRNAVEYAMEQHRVVEGGDYNLYTGVLVPITWLVTAHYRHAGGNGTVVPLRPVPTTPTVRPASKLQKDTIRRLIKPSEAATLDVDTLSYDAAQAWIEEHR